VQEYKLPDVGEGLTEAEIVSWRVAVGDTVGINDVVVEIETAKSLVELPSPYAGTVTALLVPEGETVPVGTPIISIGDPAGATPDPPSGDGPTAAERPMDLSNPSAGAENATLVGYGPRSGSALRRARRGPATAPTMAGSAAQMQVQGSFALGQADTTEVVPADEEPVPATSARPADESRSGLPGDAVVHSRSRPSGTWSVGRVRAKPPVRKLAKELGVDLRSLTPSGPDGLVTAEDVQVAAGRGANGAAVAHAGPGAPAVGAAAPSPAAGLVERREPVKGVRRMMAQAMVQSAFTVPHVTEWVTVDVTRTVRFVERLRTDRDLAGLSISPLLVLARAVCLALRRTPELNAHWDEQAQEVVFPGSVNLGIAAATPRGLVVPNIKSAEALTLPELARSLGDLVATARQGRPQPAEMSGGTFTITNVGVFGVDAGTPIINPGEAAILCLGAVRRQPWVHKGKVKARDVTTLALSFDHRFIDGATGSRFLADVAAMLHDPAEALRF
jgi:pyruvate dehydrogenase E2 component (dihydrolipoamide acetyltransferase)